MILYYIFVFSSYSNVLKTKCTSAYTSLDQQFVSRIRLGHSIATIDRPLSRDHACVQFVVAQIFQNLMQLENCRDLKKLICQSSSVLAWIEAVFVVSVV